jgi:diguanylate cyclase (GGDEF)-like protein
LAEGITSAILVVLLSYLPVPVFVVAAVVTTPLDRDWFLAAVAVVSGLLACNARDLISVRRLQWDNFTPAWVMFETMLAVLAAGLLILSTGDDASPFRQLILVCLFTAAVVGDRLFLASAWLFAVIVLATITGIESGAVSTTVVVTVLYASLWLVAVLVVDLIVRRSLVGLESRRALADLAGETGHVRSWPEDLEGLSPRIGASLDVDRASLLMQRRDGESIVELYTWPSPWPAGSASLEALARECIADGFVRRDGRAAVCASSSDLDVVVVVPDRTRHFVMVEEATPLTVARLLAAMADRAAHIDGLVDQATTDSLTGIPNRRALEDQLASELARSTREGHPVSVAMLDLDRFKDFNDAHGHPAGDRMLVTVAAALIERVRGQDFVARYGGEEFCMLLPETDGEGAFVVLRDLHERRITGEDGLAVTFSAGIAEWDEVEDAASLLARADEALYRAKRAGRDRLEMAEPPTT